MHLLIHFCLDIVPFSSALLVKMTQILCQETMPGNPVETLVDFEKAVDLDPEEVGYALAFAETLSVFGRRPVS